jgi:hypothetical protein
LKYYSADKPEKCPVCGSLHMATIVYGSPAYSEELMDEVTSGKVILGGYFLPGYDPQWECVECKTEIFQTGA